MGEITNHDAEIDTDARAPVTSAEEMWDELFYESSKAPNSVTLDLGIRFTTRPFEYRGYSAAVLQGTWREEFTSAVLLYLDDGPPLCALLWQNELSWLTEPTLTQQVKLKLILSGTFSFS